MLKAVSMIFLKEEIMIDSIEKYIQELQNEMKGSDSATRQDALSDAEDHLSSALAEAIKKQPEATEAELISQIVEEYGLPQETADAYRELDNRYPVNMNRKQNCDERKSPVGAFFAIFADTRAWGAMLYCLLSLATGVLYFSWAVTGVSVSISLMILIIGIPVAMAFFFSFHGLAFLEGRLVEALLGERMPRRQRFFKLDMSWSEKIKRLLLGRDTWLTIIYQLIMLPLGIIYFTIVVTLVSLSLGLIASPFVELIFRLPSIDVGPIVWILPKWTLPFFALLGVVILKGSLHLVKRLGWAQGKLAKKMLVV